MLTYRHSHIHSPPLPPIPLPPSPECRMTTCIPSVGGRKKDTPSKANGRASIWPVPASMGAPLSCLPCTGTGTTVIVILMPTERETSRENNKKTKEKRMKNLW